MAIGAAAAARIDPQGSHRYLARLIRARIRAKIEADCRGALGRSQVVRQRILIPPFPGSNPGAPASRVMLDAIADKGEAQLDSFLEAEIDQRLSTIVSR